MGQPKLLLPWNSSTVIETVLGHWLTTSITQAIVVLRTSDQLLADILKPIAARDPRLQLLAPAIAPQEMKQSIAAAVASIRHTNHPAALGHRDWLAIAPADLPRISACIVNRVLASLEMATTGGSLITMPTVAGRRKHPVFLSWQLADEIVSLKDGESLQTIVQRNSCQEVPCDDIATLDDFADLDTPDDYSRYQLR